MLNVTKMKIIETEKHNIQDIKNITTYYYHDVQGIIKQLIRRSSKFVVKNALISYQLNYGLNTAQQQHLNSNIVPHIKQTTLLLLCMVSIL